MKIYQWWAIAIFLVLVPSIAAANPVVKCVQRGLDAAGYDPRGIDGSIGQGTRAAATAWATDTATELPDLTTDTVPRWCAAILQSTGALPKNSVGTENFCADYPEILTGVWLFPNGAPAMGFRYASNDDGRGCYAWMNEVPDWRIHNPGSQLMTVKRDGAQRIYKRDKNSISVNTDTGLAKYIYGQTTLGVLTD